MKIVKDRLAFSIRLRQALYKKFLHNVGPTRLALEFNLRHYESSISIQTAHKWLSGRSTPNFSKIETLANWLQITEEWLLYGFDNKFIEDPNVKAMIKKFVQLSPSSQQIIRQLIDELLDCTVIK